MMLAPENQAGQGNQLSIHLFYINLEHRTDRLQQVSAEVAKVADLVAAVTRINAIHDKQNGAIGCAASHILALSEFLFKTMEDFALIMEDDFEFTLEPDRVKEAFARSIDAGQFDVIQLAYNKPIASRPNSHGLIRIYRSYTTSGYVVTRAFAYRLVSCFLESHRLLSQNRNVGPNPVVNELWAVDSWWNNVQSEFRFYGFAPPLGRQRPSFSDVVGKSVNYGV